VVLVLAATFALGFGPEGSPLVFVDETPMEFTEQDSGLVFVDETPLELTEQDALDGVSVGACNLGDESLTGLEAHLIGFDFPPGKGMQAPSRFTGELPSDQCKQVSLQAEAGFDPEPGKHRGLLVLFAQQTADIVRAVVVEAEQLERHLAIAAKPITSTNAVPMIFYREPTQRELDIAVLVSDGTLDPVKGGDLLGTLSGGPEPGYVRVVSAAEAPAPDQAGAATRSTLRIDGVRAVPVSAQAEDAGRRIVQLPVRVEGLHGVGSYSGTLNVDGEDLEAELLVTDSLWWAVLAVAIGLIVGALLLYLTRHVALRSRLWTRALGLKGKYRRAKTSFDQQVDVGRRPPPAGGDRAGLSPDMKLYRPDEADIEAYQRRLTRARRAYFGRFSLADTTSQDFKDVVKMYETAEADAQHLGDPDGFAKALKDLEGTLKKFAAFLRDEVRPARDPALVKPASALLKGGPLAVGAAKLISEQAQGYVGLIGNWRTLSADIKRYALWAVRLNERFARINPSQRHRRMLQDASAKALEAYNELLDARDAPALAELGAAEDLKASYKTLSYLGAWHRVWEPPETQKPRERRSREADRLGDVHVDLFDLSTETRREIVAALSESPESVINRWKRGAEIQRPRPEIGVEVGAEAGRLFGGFGVVSSLIVASLVTLLALIVQVYPAGAFGTLKDYLSAIAVGATSTVAINFLQGPLTGLLGRLRS
jgi:hypothetical protein